MALGPELGRVEAVDLLLFPGDWQVLVGESGVGKSTLLRCLGGTRGVAGGRLVRCPGRARIAMVDSDFPALPMPLRQVLDEGGAEALALLSTAVAREPVALATRLDELCHADRQLVALARAVAADPKLLLLDEATSALQPAQEARVIEAVRGVLPHVAALVVLHRRANQERVGTVPVLELRGSEQGAGVG